MNHAHHTSPELEEENSKLHRANAETRALLADAAEKLQAILQDEFMCQETPMEVLTAMEITSESVSKALSRLESAASRPCPRLESRLQAARAHHRHLPRKRGTPNGPRSGGPTRQQGQFLAFIREYIMRNEAGIAPSHADFQRFFNLTPPSVNSMLIRLEQRGFIRRVPGKARAIELSIRPDSIPPLDRPFKF